LQDKLNTSDIHQKIQAVQNWFHRIEVAPNIFTPGAQDSQGLLAQINLPDDMTGLRVLDIGARDGFFSFECERRGASEVIAIDYTTPESTGFLIAKELLNSKVKWITSNVYHLDESVLGRFDVILFLGVIYHLRHPYLAIDKIHDILNIGGKVIVESHVIDGGFVDEVGNWINLRDLDPRLEKLNVAQIYETGKLVNDKSNAWAPSIDTLSAMFKNSGFSIDHSWSFHFRGGLTATALELPLDHPRFSDSAEALNLKSPKNLLLPKNL